MFATNYSAQRLNNFLQCGLFFRVVSSLFKEIKPLLCVNFKDLHLLEKQMVLRLSAQTEWRRRKVLRQTNTLLVLCFLNEICCK